MKPKNATIQACTVAILLGTGPLAAQTLDSKPVLTLEVAKAMADACEAYQAANGLPPLNIAIMDDGANLKLFRRQENAFLGSVGNALEKAQTSSWFPFSSRFIEELSFGAEGNAPALPGLAHVSGVISFAGGLPIMAGDAHIGAIGISGATADQDEACAQAALGAVASVLGE